MRDGTYHIGEVASRTGLSLRTVRYYEAVGLVRPSGRTEGGFRLYTEPDVRRLLLVRSLKPLDVSLEELHELLDLSDHIAQEADAEARAALAARLGLLLERAGQRLRLQRERLIAAELALDALRSSLPAEDRPAAPARSRAVPIR